MAYEINLTDDKRKDILTALHAQAEKALTECGLIAEGYAKLELTNQGAVDTGALRNSVTNKVDMNEGSMIVGTNMEYAPYIEFGTGIYADGGRKTPWAYKGSDGEFHLTRGIKARPFIKPSIADHIKEYETIIQRVLGE